MPDIDLTILKQADEYIRSIEKGVDGIADGFDSVFESTKKANAQINAIRSENLEEISKAQKEAAKNAKELEKQEKELLKAQQALEKQRQKGLAQLAKQEAAQREYREALDMEVKSIADARKQNKALNKARNEVNASTKEGRKELKELNKRIDENNSFIKKNSDAYTQQKIGIGKYAEAIQFAVGKILIIVGVIKGLISFLSKNQEFVDKVTRAWKGLQSVLNELAGRLSKLIKGDFAGAFDDLGESITEAWKSGVRLADLTKEYKEIVISTTKVVAQLQAQEAKYQAIADDTTKSFEEREAAAKKAQSQGIAALTLEVQQAQKAFDVAEAARIEAERAGKAGVELRQEEADAYAELINKQSELQQFEIEINRTRNELRQDRLERDLDFIIDVFDAQKMVNERIIADDTKTFEERQKLLTETRTLADESFKQQIDVIQKFTDANVDLNKLLTLNNKESIEYVRTLGLSEIIEGRVLEIIRERRAAVQDLKDSEKDLAMSRLEFTQDSLDQIAELEEQIFDEIDDLAEQDFARTQRLEEKKREEAEKTADARIKQEERVKDAILSLAQDSVNFVFELNNAANEKEIQNLETQKERGLITEEGYQNKLKQIKRKQAKRDRAQQLFNIAIDTGANAVKLFAETIPPGILSAVAIAQGAIQAGIVASQPLPAFATGTTYSPEGLAIINERGRELIQDPSGSLRMINSDGATMTYLKAGSKVLPNQQTEQILRSGGQNNEIINRLNKMSSITIVPHKSKIIHRKGHYYKNYLNAKVG